MQQVICGYHGLAGCLCIFRINGVLRDLRHIVRDRERLGRFVKPNRFLIPKYSKNVCSVLDIFEDHEV